jgi:hypothetical protein
MTQLSDAPEQFFSFLDGYQATPIELNRRRIRQMAGLIAIAYSRFADTEQRRALGIALMEVAEQHLGGEALQSIELLSEAGHTQLLVAATYPSL